MNVGRGHRSLWLAGLWGAMFGVLTWNVVAGIGLAGFDDDVERAVVGHRVGWLTATLKILTWLGSSAVLAPLVGAVALFLILSARRLKEGGALAAALGGSIILSEVVKPFVDRPRPPLAVRLIHVSGSAYPSGHSIDALAAFAALTVVLSAGRSPRVRGAAIAAAALVVAVVGWSRLYLGAHWMTDVLGGYLLAGSWTALVLSGLRPPAGPARTERYPPGPGP